MLSNNQRIKVKKKKRMDYQFVASEIREKMIYRFLEEQQLKFTKKEWKLVSTASEPMWQYALKHYTEPIDAVEEWSPKKDTMPFYHMYDVSMALIAHFKEIKEAIESVEKETRKKRRIHWKDTLEYGVLKEIKDNNSKAAEPNRYHAGVIVGNRLYCISEQGGNGQPKKIKLGKGKRRLVNRYSSLPELFQAHSKYEKYEKSFEKLRERYV